MAAALVSTVAVASVTFDPVTGAGFGGKGDVQTVFGWNNATMQKNYSGLSFSADASISYDVTCEWTTVTGGKNSKVIPHTVTNHKNLTSSLAVDAVKKGNASPNYTGWYLTGFEARACSASICRRLETLVRKAAAFRTTILRATTPRSLLSTSPAHLQARYRRSLARPRALSPLSEAQQSIDLKGAALIRGPLFIGIGMTADDS